MIELRAGATTAAIDAERGGRLASLRVRARELIVGPPDGADRGLRWGSYLMAPWPGRLADGRVRFRGATYQLRRTHGRHAIHGLVWSVPWEVIGADAASAELRVDLARDGWPFGGEVRQTFTLDPSCLAISATILAEREMPAALGWHPWFDRGGEAVSLRLEADHLLERRQMLPTGRLVPVNGRTDLRDGPALGDRRLDDAFVGVRSPATVRWPDLELLMEFAEDCDTVVVFTPPTAVCVEPQTAWPNALGREPGTADATRGVRVLRPGETLTATLRLRWGPPPASS